MITLIRNIINEKKVTYSESDIPAKNMKEWIDQVYPIFENYCQSGITVENIDKELVGEIIPEEEAVPAYLLKCFSQRLCRWVFLGCAAPTQHKANSAHS